MLIGKFAYTNNLGEVNAYDVAHSLMNFPNTWNAKLYGFSLNECNSNGTNTFYRLICASSTLSFEKTLLGFSIMVDLYVVDSSEIFIGGLQQSLKSVTNIHIVGSANSKSKALDEISSLDPDIVLLGLDLPPSELSEFLVNLTNLTEPTLLVGCSWQTHEDAVLPLLEFGGRGFVHKADSLENLLEAIRTVANGSIWISPKVSPMLLNRTMHNLRDQYSLTKREHEVLILVAEGLSNEIIAGELFITVGTVKNHLANIYAKVEIHNRADLIVWAINLGLTKNN